MYVTDITRGDGQTDMLCGNDSMDAKSKTINYIIDYVFANYNINLNKDVLDQNLNIDLFSLKQFLLNNYSLKIDNDLIIQTIKTDKQHCLFLKYKDGNNDIPSIYNFNKNEEKLVKGFMQFLINDSLIKLYENNLNKYDEEKVGVEELSNNYEKHNIKSEIISLYNGGLFLEELLNNTCSLKDLCKNNIQI